MKCIKLFCTIVLQEGESATRVEDLVERYFNEVDESKSLKVLSTKALTEICHQLVDRKDNNAADNLLRYTILNIYQNVSFNSSFFFNKDPIKQKP